MFQCRFPTKLGNMLSNIHTNTFTDPAKNFFISDLFLYLSYSYVYQISNSSAVHVKPYLTQYILDTEKLNFPSWEGLFEMIV